MGFRFTGWEQSHGYLGSRNELGLLIDGKNCIYEKRSVGVRWKFLDKEMMTEQQREISEPKRNDREEPLDWGLGTVISGGHGASIQKPWEGSSYPECVHKKHLHASCFLWAAMRSL